MKSFLNITLLLIAVFFLSSFELTSKSNLRIINNIEPIDIIEGDNFNEGWEIGWCEGWKDVKGQYAYCPYVPHPPYPKYGTDNYRGGYNAGFKYGRCKAQGYENCKKQ